MKEIVGLTKGTETLINEAINRLPEEEQRNRYAICEVFCQMVEDRYTGNAMDYQLERMGVETTKRLLEKIDFVLETKKRQG